MGISYDVFTGSFLNKISEFQFMELIDNGQLSQVTSIIDGYLNRAIVQFSKVCKYDLSQRDDDARMLLADIPSDELDEIVDIISEGMLVQWMKPYVYRQENLESVLNTRDFTTYSPAELLLRISNVYASVRHDYTQMVREYTYNHGDLTDLHL